VNGPADSSGSNRFIVGVVFLILALMAVFIASMKLPVVQWAADESAGTLAMYRTLLRNPITWLYFFSIFAYVGCEQGTADWMPELLSRYHGFDRHTQGASAVSYFWGLLTAGCLGGTVLLKFFDSRRVLIGFSVGALAALTLALNSVSAHHGPFAGILCTGLMGGAIVPLIIGQLGDWFGLRTGMLVLYVTFGCILSIGFWARPLVTNALLRENNAA
jgi:fucose permease